MKKAVIEGNISTLKQQIVAFEKYQKETGESMSVAINAINDNIAELENVK